MPTVTVYGGAGVIGGNKILLEDGDTSLFFDFGTDFHTRGKYFEEYMPPRASMGLLDLLVTGLLPPLEGVYRQDEVIGDEIWDVVKDRQGRRRLDHIGAVLVSHAHLDHCGAISFLDPSIPIYASAMTGVIGKAMQDTSGTDFEREFVYAAPREPDEEGRMLKATSTKHAYWSRAYTFFDRPEIPPQVIEFWTRKPLKERDLVATANPGGPALRVGSLPARGFIIDHSIYGATAWAVETSAGWVAYTGDIRWHGRRLAEATEQFVGEVAALRPAVLICEGTQVGFREAEKLSTSEQTVLERALSEVRTARGLVIADFAPRNVERLQTFLEVARQAQRRLVILTKDAYLLDALATLDDSIPTVKEEPLLWVWDDPKARAPEWEKALLSTVHSKLVRAEHVRGHEDDYIVCWSLWDLKRLADVRSRGGKLIYSSSEVFDEEGAADVRRIRNWTELFAMQTVGLPREVGPQQWVIPEGQEGLHASGHASAEDLITLVQEIGPRMLIPVHTEHPEIFQQELAGRNIEVRVPEYGEPIAIG